MPDGHPVTWGEWQQAHKALEDRTSLVERRVEELRGVDGRVGKLEQEGESEAAAERRKRDHLWALVLGVLTVVAGSLAVTGILSLIHLGGT